MGTAMKLLVGMALVLLGATLFPLTASTASPPVSHHFLAILNPAGGRTPPRFPRLVLNSTHNLSARRVPPSRLNATVAPHLSEQPPPPLPRWGRQFVVAPLGAKRSCGDIAYILAARGTRLRYATGAGTSWVTLRAGDVLPIALQPLQALTVVASSAVAVYYFHAGTETFVAAVAPLEEFCGSYRLHTPPAATVVLVATGGGAEITVDGRPLGDSGWRRVAGGEFWWREVALGDAGGSHRLQRPNGTFAVLSYGVGRDKEGAGSRVVCECAHPDPCHGVLCRPGERCRVTSCRPHCQAVAEATCQLRVAAHTFDGAALVLPAPCDYLVAGTCGHTASVPAFSVEATVQDAGVTSLLVTVYNVTVAIARGEEGFVRVNNRSLPLPLTLQGTRVRLSRRATGLLLETDFALRVTYDGREAANVTVPSAVTPGLCGICGPARRDTGGQAGGHAGGRHGSLSGTQAFCGRLARGELFGVCREVVEARDYLAGCMRRPCSARSACRALGRYAAACEERGRRLPQWWKEEGCAPLCPENSRYNPCGCPRTCAHLDGPENCSTSCRETCECARGFVLLNGSCVAATVACGCHHAGGRYAPGRWFWADDNCTRSCVCDAGGQRVQCREDGCGGGERCRVEKGVRGCYPESYGTCSCGRDLRYVTFDGQRYDFGGSCLQELVGTCGAREGLVGFRVMVQNEGWGGHGASFASSVQVIVYGYNVSLSHRFPGRAMVDGLLVNLPHTLPEGKISIARRGWGASIRTDFRLTVTFEGRSHLAVTVPSTYAGALCGLCGNFDGDPHNDVPEAVTRGAAACNRPPPRQCSSRAIIGRKQRANGEECGLIVTPEGPFRSCHPRIDPESYFQACVTDYCVFRGHKAIVCQAVAGYAAACQEAGVVLEPWRSKTFCAPACPPHAHYELEGTSCPATCGHPENPEMCDLPRTEGCFCDDGFILSGERCVSPPDCGCHHGGRYYGRGEEFYPSDGCAQRCRCTGVGTVTCWAAPCPPGQECRVEKGVRGCHGGQRGRCVLLGARRLVTFDGLNVTLGGSCRYLLAKVCQGDGDELEVTLENGGGVTVAVGGSRVTMQSGSTWTVDVDGETRALPLSVGDGKTWVTQEGNTIVLQTAPGHRLVYVAAAVLLVTVPSTSAGRMCGLCGDFDGNGDNDFMGPNGTRVNGTRELVASWKVPDESISCSATCETCPGHPPDATGPYHAEKSCGLMVVTPGPFSDCHGQVGPEDFFEHCLQEMVLTGGAADTLCRSLGAYTAACQEAGAPVKVWRTESFCPLPCGEHSLYALCARSCERGCARLAHPLPCAGPCFEGCRCAEGFFTDGHRCLLPSTCGCFQEGRYLPVLEEVLVGNCSRRCTCYLHGTLLCEAARCSPGTDCGVRGGRRVCLPQGGP